MERCAPQPADQQAFSDCRAAGHTDSVATATNLGQGIKSATCRKRSHRPMNDCAWDFRTICFRTTKFLSRGHRKTNRCCKTRAIDNCQLSSQVKPPLGCPREPRRMTKGNSLCLRQVLCQLWIAPRRQGAAGDARCSFGLQFGALQVATGGSSDSWLRCRCDLVRGRTLRVAHIAWRRSVEHIRQDTLAEQVWVLLAGCVGLAATGVELDDSLGLPAMSLQQ